MVFNNMNRSPTFLVDSAKQKDILSSFKKDQQHLTEEYQNNKPLCFNARAFQQTHPAKIRMGYKDADATLTSPMLLGVCDGVSQLEEFGMDPALLPNELLQVCEEIAMSQLIPDTKVQPADMYRGPIHLLKSAYENTESFGSTTVLLAALDNSTRIHGKLHPMVAVLSIGDCELLMLRRTQGRQGELEAVFHTEMQRIDQNAQTPLQLARVDARIDEEFEESIALEVIEKGSAVHCVSAYEGDILILGSDGVFDNLYLDEVVDICNQHLRPSAGSFQQTQAEVLSQIAQRIVFDSHAKSSDQNTGSYPDTPIGRGGKVDDTSVVVGEVVEWTNAHLKHFRELRSKKQWSGLLSCGGGAGRGACNACGESDDDQDDGERGARAKTRGLQAKGHGESDDDSVSSEEEQRCAIS